ncbi:branched-chain-amino-acid aminotransferase-like [Ceratitis capitata]|uniref:branched-chain-amino-acid aminotransferase-like n=1 Tax=Ceratitis capitata TaxID=7213 RepID=UPI000A105C07|nr:branched-chain-amino-acid aminotransferase-like [Ceratitis capitata]
MTEVVVFPRFFLSYVPESAAEVVLEAIYTSTVSLIRQYKVLVTPPLNGLILPGITRDSILALTKQWGKFEVREEVITMPQVSQLLNEGRLLELFGTGTACVVSPINRINYMGTNLYIPTMEQEKPIHETIRETLTGIQYGKIEHPWAVTID